MAPHQTLLHPDGTVLSITTFHLNRTFPYRTEHNDTMTTHDTTKRNHNMMQVNRTLRHRYCSSLNITLPKPLQNKTKPHRTLPYQTDTNHDGTILYLTIPLQHQTQHYDTRPYSTSAVLPSTTLHLTKTRQNATALRFTGPILLDTGQ